MHEELKITFEVALSMVVHRLRTVPITYDVAVSLLGPFVHSGWIAQDEDGRTWWYSEKPRLHMDDGVWVWDWGWDGGEILRLNLPRHHDWRTSLRRIDGREYAAEDVTQ